MWFALTTGFAAWILVSTIAALILGRVIDNANNDRVVSTPGAPETVVHHLPVRPHLVRHPPRPTDTVTARDRNNDETTFDCNDCRNPRLRRHFQRDRWVRGDKPAARQPCLHRFSLPVGTGLISARRVPEPPRSSRSETASKTSELRRQLLPGSAPLTMTRLHDRQRGDSGRIVIVGTGLIGSFLGGWLLDAGANVVFVARSPWQAATSQNGLRVAAVDGRTAWIEPERCTVISVTDIVPTDTVVLTVKSLDTPDAAAQLAASGTASAILSVQNGISNLSTISLWCPSAQVSGGMVPFNVVHDAHGVYRQTTRGSIVLGTVGSRMAGILSTTGLSTRALDDATVASIQAGKLLLNLNNAVHSLSGVSLREELSDRGYRRILAEAQHEAAQIFAAQQIPARSPVSGVPLAAVPRILALPDRLVAPLVSAIVGSDPRASSSMRDDLVRGRRTEIDYMNGEIARLAKRSHQLAPVNAALTHLIRQAELSTALPAMTPTEIRAAITAHSTSRPV